MTSLYYLYESGQITEDEYAEMNQTFVWFIVDMPDPETEIRVLIDIVALTHHDVMAEFGDSYEILDKETAIRWLASGQLVVR